MNSKLDYLTAYVPHKPEFEVHEDREIPYRGVLSITNIMRFGADPVKLILRPFSDLDKKFDGYDPDFLLTGTARFLQKSSKLSHNPDSLCPDGLMWRDVQYLLKNHFDVFDLIPKGEAIDINTVEQ